MLKRKIMNKLNEWKKSNEKVCLLVKGARQVGKTFIIREFGKSYKNFVEINFEIQKDSKKIFDGNLDVETLKNNLEIYFNRNDLFDGDTLLFLDEIQSCPNARIAIKTFAENRNIIDVIASGSLLGLNYEEVSSYPVGYEKQIELYPLDFEEFLWSILSDNKYIEICRNDFNSIKVTNELVIEKMSEYFKKYMLVGGMPAAVNAYLKDNKISDATEVHKLILNSYKLDVQKYAKNEDKQKILKTFESIPYQLSKKNKKFVYSEIKDNNNKEGEVRYFSSLKWLKDASIIHFCYNLSEPALPLASNIRDNSFKIYMKDTGLLLGTMENNIYNSINLNDIYVNEGAILENICAFELSTRYNNVMYYERKSKLEIDFIQNINGIVTAIEVKSGNNKQSKSLNSIIDNYPSVKRYIKLENDNKIYKDEKGIEHYPLFMIMFI